MALRKRQISGRKKDETQTFFGTMMQTMQRELGLDRRFNLNQLNKNLNLGDDMMKSLDGLLETLKTADLGSKAKEKGRALEKELKKYVKTLKSLDANFTQTAVFEALLDNVNDVLGRVQDLEVLEFAKGKVSDTKHQIFSMLDIPSQIDVDHLTRKISHLEKKVNTLSKSKRSTTNR